MSRPKYYYVIFNNDPYDRQLIGVVKDYKLAKPYAHDHIIERRVIPKGYEWDFYAKNTRASTKKTQFIRFSEKGKAHRFRKNT